MQGTPLAASTTTGVYSELRACRDGFVCLFESHSTPMQLMHFVLHNSAVASVRVLGRAGLVMPPEVTAMLVKPKEIEYGALHAQAALPHTHAHTHTPLHTHDCAQHPSELSVRRYPTTGAANTVSRGLFYAAPGVACPPVIVFVHGGPTGYGVVSAFFCVSLLYVLC